MKSGDKRVELSFLSGHIPRYTGSQKVQLAKQRVKLEEFVADSWGSLNFVGFG